MKPSWRKLIDSGNSFIKRKKNDKLIDVRCELYVQFQYLLVILYIGYKSVGGHWLYMSELMDEQEQLTICCLENENNQTFNLPTVV